MPDHLRGQVAYHARCIRRHRLRLLLQQNSDALSLRHAYVRHTWQPHANVRLTDADVRRVANPTLRQHDAEPRRGRLPDPWQVRRLGPDCQQHAHGQPGVRRLQLRRDVAQPQLQPGHAVAHRAGVAKRPVHAERPGQRLQPAGLLALPALAFALRLPGQSVAQQQLCAYAVAGGRLSAFAVAQLRRALPRDRLFADDAGLEPRLVALPSIHAVQGCGYAEQPG